MPSMLYISSGGNQMNINNVTFDRGIMAHTSDFREAQSHPDSNNFVNPPTYEEAVHQHSVINSNNS